MNQSNEFLPDILFSTIACAAFAATYNIRPKNILFSALGAMISETLYAGGIILSFGEILSTITAAAACALFSEIMARRLKEPANMYLIISIIPLVPGKMLYSTMSAFIQNDISGGIEQAVNTIAAAGAIAMGILIVSSAFAVKSRLKKR